MREILINLNSINNVKSFNEVIAQFDCDVDLISENRRYVIDAKSIMGIFSLDLSKNITLRIHDDGALADSIIAAVDKYIVK